MKFNYASYRLECIHPFGISRSSFSSYDRIFIYLINDGIIGRGEAAPSPRYNENVDQIKNIINDLNNLPIDTENIDEAEKFISNVSSGITSLEAALSMAYLDWYGQKNEMAVAEILGSTFDLPETSFTIAIGDLKGIPKKLSEAKKYPVLKIKLGTPQDRDIMRLIRDNTDKPVRIDANEGWDLKTAIDMCQWLADKNVQFVEQPIKSANLEESALLKSESPIKIIADENCINETSIPQIAHAFHGINIKLSKCGSLFEANRMIKTARKFDLDVMLGCMVESSVGISAAAHLASQVDYADLDGNVLINNDPYSGVLSENGKLMLDPERSGLGLILNDGIDGSNLGIL